MLNNIWKTMESNLNQKVEELLIKFKTLVLLSCIGDDWSSFKTLILLAILKDVLSKDESYD